MPILTAIRSGTENAMPPVADCNHDICFPVIFLALPWGMPKKATVRLTPKVHSMQWYTSGFT